MEAKDHTESESHQSKEKKKDETTRKLASTGKNVTKPGVTRKNVEKRHTSVTKSGVSGENVTKCGSPSKNGAKLNANSENASKQTVNSKTTHKTGVARRHSKPWVKPILANDSDTKPDAGKDVPDESNTSIKPCVTDSKQDVTKNNITKPSDSDTKPDAGKDVPDKSNTDNTNIKPCVTDMKQDVTEDTITKPSESKTSETDTMLDADITETGSDVPTLNETQADRTEKTESESEQTEITDGNEDSDDEHQAVKETTKKKEPKSGVTIANMIDDAVHSFEEEDYLKCIIICDEIMSTNWKDPNDQDEFSLAFLYMGKSYERLEELENALKYYRFSLAVSKNLALSQHIEEIALILEQRKRDSAEGENKKGNDCFKSKQFKEALAYYTEAIKRNPEQAKFYGNRSACYLKLKEYILSLSDAQNCIRFDPKSVKGYFREGSAYLALNKPSKACASYSNILQIDPDNEEAKKHYSKSTERARLDPNDSEAVKKRIEEEPELIQILNDSRVRSFLSEMEKDPTAVKKYMHDISTRKKIQKLLECGLLNASGPNHLFQR